MAALSPSGYLIVFSGCDGALPLFQAGRGFSFLLHALLSPHHCLRHFYWVSARPTAHLRSSFLCTSPSRFRCRLDYWHYLAFRGLTEPVPILLQSRCHERRHSIVLSRCVLYGRVFQFVLCGSSELDQRFPSRQWYARVVVPLDACRTQYRQFFRHFRTGRVY